MGGYQEAGAAADDRRPIRRLLIITDLVWFAMLAVAWFPAIFSVMFASGGTSVRVHIQIYSLLTFPVVLVVSILVPWLFYRLRMDRTARTVLFFPIVNIVLILLYILIPSWLA